MENASKALIMAGSVLITIMIIAVAVYIFQKGKDLSNSTYSVAEATELQSFNSKFTVFETSWGYGNTITNDDERYKAPSNLNTISNVISAVNLATSTNYQNNYGYKYYNDSLIETINAVEVIIDMSSNRPSGFKKYYLVEPNKNVNQNYVYGKDSLSTVLSADARSSRISSFSTSNETSCNELLKALSETKLVQYNNSNYTLYRYYFECETSISEQTGKIDSVKFTIVCDTKFDDL